MRGKRRSCFGRFVTVFLLVGAAWAGIRWGPQILTRVREWAQGPDTETPASLQATPELADSVVRRVQAFRGSEEGTSMSLGGREVTSVLRYAVPGLVPSGILEPRVTFRDGRVFLRARVAVENFPELPDLGGVLGVLPDTLDVELEASLMPFGPDQAAFLVRGVQASRIPLPRRIIPQILGAIGRTELPGLPPEALVIPLPAGLESAYILTDSLILNHVP